MINMTLDPRDAIIGDIDPKDGNPDPWTPPPPLHPIHGIVAEAAEARVVSNVFSVDSGGVDDKLDLSGAWENNLKTRFVSIFSL